MNHGRKLSGTPSVLPLAEQKLRSTGCDDDGPVSIVRNSKTMQELAKIAITLIEGF
jgi:hypothetical protein